MNKRENLIRTIRFETPEYIPMDFIINDACWNHYDHNALFDLIESHSLLFPDFKRPDSKYKPQYLVTALADIPYTDPWNCVWKTAEDGITGSVHGHPLASLDSFAKYGAPDSSITDGTYPIDWNLLSKEVEALKASGKFILGGLPHGHTFLRIQDIRGYENFIFDMVDEIPDIFKLIEMVEEFNYSFISKWIGLEPDMISYPEDLFYRINSVIIEIPSLRDRKEDIPSLSSFFLKRFSFENKKILVQFWKQDWIILTDITGLGI